MSETNVTPIVASDGKAVCIAVIKDPYNPKDFSLYATEFTRPVTIAELLPYDLTDYVVGINGNPISKGRYAEAIACPGDTVALAPIPRGGSEGRKNMLRIAAAMAVTVVGNAAGAGVAANILANGPVQMASGTIMALSAAATVAVNIAGMAVVNALLPVEPLRENRQEIKDSPSYSLQGNTNPNAYGIPVPVIYGEFRTTPNRVMTFTKNTTEKNQDLYMLYALSEGPIDGVDIESVLINDRPASEYDTYDEEALENRVAVSTLLVQDGDNDQFWPEADEGVERRNGQSLVAREYFRGQDDIFSTTSIQSISEPPTLQQTPPYTFTTGVVDQVELRFSAPNGFRAITQDGTSEEYRSILKIQFREVGSGTWKGVASDEYRIGYRTNVTYYPDTTYPLHGQTWSSLPIASHSKKYRYKVRRNGSPTSPGGVLQTTWSCRTFQLEMGQHAVYARGNLVVLDRTPRTRQQLRDLGIPDKYHFIPTAPVYKDSDVEDTLVYDNIPQGWQTTYGANDAVWLGAIGKAEAVDAYESGVFVFQGHSTSEITKTAIVRTFTGYPAAFEIRVWRLDEDLTGDENVAGVVNDLTGHSVSAVVNQITLNSYTEVIDLPVHYVNTALLGIRVSLNEKIRSVPNVSVICRGRRIKTRRINESGVYEWSEPVFSSNPAWIVYDMLTDPRVGMGVDQAKIDIDKFQEWADFCESELLEFNGVFETKSSVWDAMQHVLRVGHAQIYRVGTQYSVAIEGKSEPVQLFNASDIEKGSLNINYSPLSEQSNEVEITYFDGDRASTANGADSEILFRPRTLRIISPDFNPSLDQQRTLKYTAIGVTNQQQAYSEGVYLLNTNRLVRSTISFRASISALAMSVGDVFLFQHDFIDETVGGRLQAGSTNSSLKLDRPVTIEAGYTYKAVVTYDAATLYSGNVVEVHTPSVDGTRLIEVSGYDFQKPVDRIVLGGKDYPIRGFVEDFDALVISSDIPVSNGQAFSLVKVDHIEEVTVQDGPGEYDEIEVSGLPDAPALHAKFIVGRSTQVKKPYRCITIGESDGYARDISAVEYHDAIYDLDSEFIPLPSPDLAAIGQVRNLRIEEEFSRIGKVERPLIRLSWDTPALGVYAGADVYMALNGVGNWQQVGSIRGGATTFTYELNAGDYVRFQVVAVDSFGRFAPRLSAPMVEYDVLGKLTPPSDIDDLDADLFYEMVVLKWTQPADKTIDHSNIYINLDEDDFETAILIGSSTTSEYPNPTQEDAWYWVTSVDTNGNESGPSNSVYAQPLAAPASVDVITLKENAETFHYRSHVTGSRGTGVASIGAADVVATNGAFGGSHISFSGPGPVVYPTIAGKINPNLFSFFTWVRRQRSGVAEAIMGNWPNMRFGFDANNRLQLAWTSSGGVETLTAPALTVADNDWHLVGFSVFNSNPQLNLYLDNEFFLNDDVFDPVTISQHLVIGDQSMGGGQNFVGDLNSPTFFYNQFITKMQSRQFYLFRQPFIDPNAVVIAPNPSNVTLELL